MQITPKSLVRLATHPKLLFSRNIFLFSHMRANTSLLGHILGSHPEIEGYYEMHMAYSSRKSLWRQKFSYIRDHAPKTTSHILFDKLLHNHYTVLPDLIRTQKTRTIFMLRGPERSIKSIVELYLKKNNNHELSNPEQAALYYIDRLNKLSAISEDIPNRFYYLDAESITEVPQPALSSLSAWLELKTPLKPEYILFSKTGKEKSGDSSEYIKLGKIVKDRKEYNHIYIPPALLQDADYAYRKCRSKIIQNSGAHFESQI